jgi:hypothetical protein
MDVSELVTPVTTTYGDKGELGGNEGSLDGNLDFLGELDTETNVALVVTDDNDGLKAGTLTGLGLLLDGYDLHHLVGEGTLGLLDELVNNGGLFDGDGVSVNFLEGGNVSVLDETAELGLGNPVVLVATETAAGTATTSTAATVTTATTTVTSAVTTASESATATAAFNCCCLLLGSFTFHLF